MTENRLKMIDYNKVKLVMFDLDGTLYEDDAHFDFYAEQLKQSLPLDLQKQFEHDYEKAKIGKHALQIGRLYDKQQDWIFTQKAGQVELVMDWNGHMIEKDEWQPFFMDGWRIDMDRIFSIGDAWWIPNALARHYGLTPEQTHEAFIATREYMMTPAFHMTKIPGLTQMIHHLQKNLGWITVLVTNSPEVDSRAILQKLDLADCFTEFVFRARKPVRTNEVVQSLCAQFQISYSQVLSIGDNYMNEVLPIIALGGQAIHINLYHIPEELMESVPRVDSMKEIVADMSNRFNR